MTPKLSDTIEVLERIFKEKRRIEAVNPQGIFTNETKEEVEALSTAISSLQLLPELVGALEDAVLLLNTEYKPAKMSFTEYDNRLNKMRQALTKAKAEELG